MKSLFTFTLTLTLTVTALAQPSLQVQGRRGGIHLDGRGQVEVQGQNQSVNLQSGASGTGMSASDWRNASVSRGPQGQWILSDPNQGSIIMERGLQGKTHFQTREGSFTLDNSMLWQFKNGGDFIEEQLRGR